jgi:phenylpyruvate tautomerase PptA (4-oxalocrotonate tautomerase family)
VPLVPIELVQGRPEAEITRLAVTVQAVTEDVFAAPSRDRRQIVTGHPPGRMILQDSGLGFTRTDRAVVIQVVQQGRDGDQKRALYAALAERREQNCGVAPEDLIVSLVSNSPADWSFGMGRAQFLEGDLSGSGLGVSRALDGARCAAQVDGRESHPMGV